MVIKLNKTTSIQLCDVKKEGALNAWTFEAKEDWVVKKDNGERFATRFTYSTLHCRKHGEYFECGNPKVAIQQAIRNALNGAKQSDKKLQDTYFTLIFTEAKPEKVEPPKKLPNFNTDKERYDFNVWLEHYHIKGKGIEKGKKYIIIKVDGTFYNLYIHKKEFTDWFNERVKEFKASEENEKQSKRTV